jgi:hypothetical protein
MNHVPLRRAPLLILAHLTNLITSQANLRIQGSNIKTLLCDEAWVSAGT